MPDVACTFWKNQEESVAHVLLACPLVAPVWSWAWNWLGMNISPQSSFIDMSKALNSSVKSSRVLKLAMALLGTIVWLLWLNRNGAIFRKVKFSESGY